MTEIGYTIEKPFAVVVQTADGKTMKKEMDTEAEAETFRASVAAKLPDAKVEIVQKQERIRGREGQANSIGFTPVVDRKTMNQMIDAFGRPVYKPIRVPFKRGFLFCTNCHDYRVFGKVPHRYDDSYQGCQECGMGVNDFDIKTCNGLWERTNAK